MFDLDRFVGSGAVFSPCLPPPPTVPRHLVGDWEAFLALMGMREWMEGIQARVSTWGVLQHTHEYPSVLTKKTHDPTDAAARLPVRGGGGRAAPAPRWVSDSLIRHSAVSISSISSLPTYLSPTTPGIDVDTSPGSAIPRLLLRAPHARVHAHVGPPLVGKGIHYLRLRPYLTETGGGAIQGGTALEGEGPGQGRIRLAMRSIDHPSQRQVRSRKAVCRLNLLFAYLSPLGSFCLVMN